MDNFFRGSSALVLTAAIVLSGCVIESKRGPLEGAWEMVSATYTLADSTYDPGFTQTKILTAEHFSFGRQTETGALSGGGRYSFDGEKYTETIDYHYNASHVGKALTFEARLEGDSIWHHSGQIGENYHIYEVWKRIGR